MNGTMIQFFHWYTEGGGKLWEEVKKQRNICKSWRRRKRAFPRGKSRPEQPSAKPFGTF